jgi:MFS family permease
LTQEANKNRYLTLLGAAHSLNHSLFVITSPLLTLILASLGTDWLAIGTVSSAASFIYGVGALAGGPLGDRIGEVRAITMALALAGASTFIMLLSSITTGIVIYALALILMAVFASLYHPTANSLISKSFSGRMSEAMGLHGVGGTLGVMLTPTVAYFIGAAFGWQWAFVAFGLLSIALALVFIRVFRGTNVTIKNGGTVLDALKIRELWLLLIFNVAVGLFMKGVELFFPTYLYENRGINQALAAIAYTAVLAAGVPGQWIGGKTADKIGSKKVLIATSTGVFLGFISLLLFPAPYGILAFIALYGVAFYAHQPALNSLTGFLSPQNQRGAVYGIFFFTSFGIGSLSQFMAGYMADAYGLDAAFYLLAVFALIALLLSFKLPKKRESKEA